MSWAGPINQADMEVARSHLRTGWPGLPGSRLSEARFAFPGTYEHAWQANLTNLAGNCVTTHALFYLESI